MKSLLSIHDVMPATLSEVQALVELIPPEHLSKLTMLVVPGLQWTPADLERLHRWQAKGIRWAGHGWVHTCAKPRSLYHHLHSRFISRSAAEHLSLSRAQLKKLLHDNYQWFLAHRLNAPELYVPPAWAMGALQKTDLPESPFAIFETTSAVIDAKSGRVYRLPLAGFEADTAMRSALLRGWNAINKAWSTAADTPLRIALHPYDLQYRLARQLRDLIKQLDKPVGYDELFQQTTAKK